MNINEVIKGWTFEETVKTAENLMEAEKNLFKWDVIRHLRDFAETYREQLKEYQQLEEQSRMIIFPCNKGDKIIGENMEDRYLFKVKRIDNGEWVVGFYAYIHKKHYIYTGQLIHSGLYDVAERFEVDPSTICRCTGREDKNGNLIWENDIVKCLYNCYDENYVYIGKMIYKEDTCRFVAVNSESTDYEWWDEEKEVIGNIFDNPELLNKR